MPGYPIPSREPSNAAGVGGVPRRGGRFGRIIGAGFASIGFFRAGLFQTGDSGLTVVGDCLDESLDCAKPP